MLWWWSPAPACAHFAGGSTSAQGRGLQAVMHMDSQVCKVYKWTSLGHKFAVNLFTITPGLSSSAKQTLTSGLVVSVVKDTFNPETTVVLPWLLKTEIHWRRKHCDSWDAISPLLDQNPFNYIWIWLLLHQPKCSSCRTEAFSWSEFWQVLNVLKGNSEDLRY